MKGQSLDDRWVQYQRKNHKTTQSWACVFCPDRRIFHTAEELWQHAILGHKDKLPTDRNELMSFRTDMVFKSSMERPAKDVPQPRKRAAIGDGISTGSGSTFRKSESPPPHRLKARSTSLPHSSNSYDSSTDKQRQQVIRKQLWTADQDSFASRLAFGPSNIMSVQAQRSRGQDLAPNPQKFFQATPLTKNPRSSSTVSVNAPQELSAPSNDAFDIIHQPETRPISQEQLVAEVKGIYAGLVMVEAKCIEVDNKLATLAQADNKPQTKLNNEQWQALIALHRTLLHEHHDFFLASQHPSASLALKRLASKYAMPARMWRHGIHSFLELLRHRLPDSLEHMLAFIYLAYSMMSLLLETVPAFEDTWIECLGDLGRYRIAIEDNDIREREVWTNVARHWYSKASDKNPTTSRLYHHLAILARPNALQQLFCYSKSLCVQMPFTSIPESILTLFNPVLDAENGQGPYRLPPLDTMFVKAHGLLFAGRNMERFGPTIEEYPGILDDQFGRVTRKFMEEGYHIAVANSISMLGFSAKDNTLMRSTPKEETSPGNISLSSSRNTQILSNAALETVLGRIGDPNVLPFIHIKLAFMFHVHFNAGKLLEADFPWESLTTTLNTLLAFQQYERIEKSIFPLPEKDDTRPFPEDFALRGHLWADGYYPKSWFEIEKIDNEEKFYELASMTEQRKKRILWLAHRISLFARSAESTFLGVLKNKTFQSLTLLTRVFKSFRIATALVIPIHPQLESDGEGPSHFFEDIWRQLRDQHSGPILMNTAVATLLSGSYFVITYCDEVPWPQRDLLPIATATISTYSLYLGNGEWISDWQLAMLGTHNVRLSIKFLRQKLSEFPKSMKPTAFCTASASLASAGIITRLLPTSEGRYKNPLVQAAMLLPLTNVFFTAFWIIFIRNSGVAKSLEEGALSAAILGFWQKRSYAIIAFILILVLLAKV